MSLNILQRNIGTPFFNCRLEKNYTFPYNLFHDRRVNFVKQKIEESNPDILCLQEYLPDEFELETMYPHHIMVKCEHHPIFYTAIFSKKPFNSSYIDPQWAFVCIQQQDLRVISLHLETHNSTARMTQLERAINTMHISNDPCVCTGDFNYFQIFGKYIFQNDKKSHELFLDSANYIKKGAIGSYILPLELDRLYYKGDLAITQKTSTLYSQFPGLDHFPTIFSVSRK